MLRILFALIWFAVGAGTGTWVHGRLIRAHGATTGGRFLANWASTTCYFLGVAGMLVLADDGWQRSWGTWVRWSWPEAIAFALAAGVLMGVILTFSRQSRAADTLAALGDPPPFADAYIEDILAAEGRATPDECRRMARRLVKTSRRTGVPLPPGLLDFVRRHLAAGYPRGGG